MILDYLFLKHEDEGVKLILPQKKITSLSQALLLLRIHKTSSCNPYLCIHHAHFYAYFLCLFSMLILYAYWLNSNTLASSEDISQHYKNLYFHIHFLRITFVFIWERMKAIQTIKTPRCFEVICLNNADSLLLQCNVIVLRF